MRCLVEYSSSNVNGKIEFEMNVFSKMVLKSINLKRCVN